MVYRPLRQIGSPEIRRRMPASASLCVSLRWLDWDFPLPGPATPSTASTLYSTASKLPFESPATTAVSSTIAWPATGLCGPNLNLKHPQSKHAHAHAHACCSSLMIVPPPTSPSSQDMPVPHPVGCDAVTVTILSRTLSSSSSSDVADTPPHQCVVCSSLRQ